MEFDFAAFKRAFVGQDPDAWAACFHADAEWTEYRNNQPPSTPYVHRGREAIRRYLGKVTTAGLILVIEDDMGTGGRYAFRVLVTRADGARVVEHVMLYVEDGLIVRQVDVEAWD